MRVGIVGSRTFERRDLVEKLVETLEEGTTVISGGAAGVDTWAIEAAKKANLETEEYLPDKENIKSYFDATKRMHERNQRIVDESDVIYAFTEKDKGGTWDTIKRAKRKGIPVHIEKGV